MSWSQCWWCNGALGRPWRRDPRVKFCDACGERTVDPEVLKREAAEDRRKRRSPAPQP